MDWFAYVIGGVAVVIFVLASIGRRSREWGGGFASADLPETNVDYSPVVPLVDTGNWTSDSTASATCSPPMDSGSSVSCSPPADSAPPL